MQMAPTNQMSNPMANQMAANQLASQMNQMNDYQQMALSALFASAPPPPPPTQNTAAPPPPPPQPQGAKFPTPGVGLLGDAPPGQQPMPSQIPIPADPQNPVAILAAAAAARAMMGKTVLQTCQPPVSSGITIQESLKN